MSCTGRINNLRDILIWMPNSNPYPARVPLSTDAQKSHKLSQCFHGVLANVDVQTIVDFILP